MDQKHIILKVKQGTPKHHDGSSMCHSCSLSTIIKGTSLGEEIISCGNLSGYGGGDRIRFKVTSCNQYKNVSEPTVSQMESIAWILRTDARTKRIGFTPFKELKDKEKPPSLDPEAYWDSMKDWQQTNYRVGGW